MKSMRRPLVIMAQLKLWKRAAMNEVSDLLESEYVSERGGDVQMSMISL